MKLEKLIEGYRLYCQAEGKSPHTLRWYMGKLAVFSDYIHKQDSRAEAADVDTLAIRSFVAYLQTSVKADELNPHKPTKAQPLSGQTIQGYVRVIKAFFLMGNSRGLAGRQSGPRGQSAQGTQDHRRDVQ